MVESLGGGKVQRANFKDGIAGGDDLYTRPPASSLVDSGLFYLYSILSNLYSFYAQPSASFPPDYRLPTSDLFNRFYLGGAQIKSVKHLTSPKK